MLAEHTELLRKQDEAKKALEKALTAYHASRDAVLKANVPGQNFEARDTSRVQVEFTSGNGEQRTAQIVTDC